MSKKCIFNEKVQCSNCGKCDICDLDDNKICDNCGKCLQLDKLKSRSINIDEVYENLNNNESIIDVNRDISSENLSKDFLQEESLTEQESYDIMDKNELWTYIEDQTGLKEILENKILYEATFEEEFPGLILLKNQKQE